LSLANLSTAAGSTPGKVYPRVTLYFTKAFLRLNV
jgi:hypothetical protein